MLPSPAFATISVDQFVANTTGQQLSNAQGTYAGECVSLVSQYLLQVHGITTGAWGNAIDYQSGGSGGNHLASNGFSWSTDQNFLNGDILVWGPNAAAGTSSYGHVGIWYGGKVYDQNDGRHSPARTAGYSTFWTGGYLGHWRRGGMDTGRPSIVAPGDAGFSRGGAASGWTSFSGGAYGTAIYSYVNNTGRDNWARWTFDLSKLNGTAIYQVQAYITGTHAGTRSADYHINAANGLQHHTVNQYATTGWTDLGTYTLNAGSAWVELDDFTGEPYAVNVDHQIAFDAIKLVYVGPVAQPASLSVVGAVNLSAGTRAVGSTVTGSFTVKNTGGQSGTWAPLVLALRGPSGQSRDAVASASLTLAAGESKTVTFSRQLDLAGMWTGFVSGQISGSWQNPAGATVSFNVAPALPKASVSAPVAPSTMYRGRHYTIYGYVAPKHTIGTYLVTLKFYKRNSAGVYVYHHSVSARRYSYSSSKTKYKADTSLPHSGRWRVRAYHSCSEHAGSYSGYDYITVK